MAESFRVQPEAKFRSTCTWHVSCLHYIGYHVNQKSPTVSPRVSDLGHYWSMEVGKRQICDRLYQASVIGKGDCLAMENSRSSRENFTLLLVIKEAYIL